MANKQQVLKGVLSLVIPRTGKMTWSSVGSGNRALCFNINKGYIESDSYKAVAYFVISRNRTKPNWLQLVGKIDKVRLFNGSYVYRQRVFFNNLLSMCELCSRLGVSVWLPKDFHIEIQSIMGVLTYATALEYYAKMYGETIDVYLTNTCKVQFANVLKTKDVISTLTSDSEYIIANKTGYLDKAPFILGSCNVSEKTSSVFINTAIEDERMYTVKDLSDVSSYGFTEEMLKKDKHTIIYGKGIKDEGKGTK